MKNRRTKYWINNEVQWGYIKFLFLFWFISFCLSILGFLMIFTLQIYSENAKTNTLASDTLQFYQSNPLFIFNFFAFHFLASMIFGFYFFRSFSHRVCGPIYNIENKIKDMNANTEPGKEFADITIRKNDYFQPLVKELNTLIKNKKSHSESDNT